ncbi:hypothetical protein D9M70_527850 [compost metagenome]
MATRDPAFDILPIAIADVAGAALVPVLPGIGSRAQDLALPVTPKHRPGRDVDSRQSSAGSPHQQSRGGFVTTAHEHHPINRMGPNQFLRVHRQHVAIEHGGGFYEVLRQRNCRQLNGEPTCLQDATLDILDSGLEMSVARVDVRPRVEDGNDRFASPISRRVPHLHDSGAMSKPTQVVRRKPARTSQIFGFLSHD